MFASPMLPELVLRECPDRRRQERFIHREAVHVDGCPVAGRDISASGIGVVMRAPVRTGDLVHVTFENDSPSNWARWALPFEEPGDMARLRDGLALERLGRIDILIHNAGIVRRGTLKEITYEDFEQVLDVHLRGAFHVVRPAFPLMCKAGYGRVVLTSSINGLYGNRNVVNYCVAKAGIIGLSNVVALEGADEGVVLLRV